MTRYAALLGAPPTAICTATTMLILLAVAGCTRAHGPTPAADSATHSPTISTVTANPSTTAPTSASSTPQTTQPAVSAKAAALASYLAMWRDFASAGHTSNWKSPTLAAHATGDALLQMSRGMYADHYNGLITKGYPVDHPTVTKATPAAAPTTILISDCGDSSHWLQYVAKTGKLAHGEVGGLRSITAEVKRLADGSWKVDRFAVEGLGSC